MRKSVLTACVCLFLVAAPHFSYGWGVLGHRVVGGIAEHHLNKKAKAAVRDLLGNESVAMAGNYGDFIKSDRTYDYLNTWHYVNLPAGMQASEVRAYLRQDTGTNLYTRIIFLVKELKNRALPRDRQIFYLKLLIHFVGDAHQPMHAGHAEDRGGNDVKVNWFSVPSNLHRVWDEQLVEFQQLSCTEHIAAIDFSTPDQRHQWQQQPVSQWILESYQYAAKIYASVKPEERLGYLHNYQFVKIMNDQLLKGGIRLAGLLNEIYGK